MQPERYDFGAVLDAIYNPQPIFTGPFFVNGREFRLVRWHDGWVWRDDKTVTESTDYERGPWGEAWEAQQDAMGFAARLDNGIG